ncbi:MAG: hypothetical protein ACUVSJ_13910, partial [Anaerolineae bacterium]
MRIQWFVALVLLTIGVILAAPIAPVLASGPETTVSQEKPFEGVEVNVLTFTGPQIAEPLQRRGPDFTALTGAKINVIVVPFSDLYQK